MSENINISSGFFLSYIIQNKKSFFFSLFRFVRFKLKISWFNLVTVLCPPTHKKYSILLIHKSHLTNSTIYKKFLLFWNNNIELNTKMFHIHSKNIYSLIFYFNFAIIQKNNNKNSKNHDFKSKQLTSNNKKIANFTFKHISTAIWVTYL